MNRREKDVCEADDRAIKTVAEHYGIGVPHFNTEEYQKPFLTITDDLSRRFDNTYRSALEDLVSEAREEEAAMRMGHVTEVDLLDSTGGRVSTRAEHLEAALREGLSELRELRSHRCEFDANGDGVCPICGADGRA